MTRFWLWALLTMVATAGAFLGVWSEGTATASVYFSALALSLQWLFGEEA